MTPEERQMLAGLFERINANGSAPRDAEAEAFINDAVRAAPHAPYVLAQTTLVQQQALEAAAHRIAELEAAAHEAAERQGQEQGSFLGNLGKSIFGGGAPSTPRRAPAMIPAPIRAGRRAMPHRLHPSRAMPRRPLPNMRRRGPDRGAAALPAGGGGFLQNAASTAAGVAGGVALGNLLGGLFGGHRAAACSAAASAARGSAAAPRPRPSTTTTRLRRTRSDPGQMEPERPGRRGLHRRLVLRRWVGRGGFDDV